jgi:hypothetical protein
VGKVQDSDDEDLKSIQENYAHIASKHAEEWKAAIEKETIEKLAKKFECDGIEGRRPHVPMNPTLKFKKAGVEDIVLASKFDYASTVGGLLYLFITARPDIAQSIGVLSRYMSCPSEEACSAARQVIKYLYATKEYGITYTRDSGGSPHIKSSSRIVSRHKTAGISSWILKIAA